MVSYGFNAHALRRFHESLTDALDPNGVLSSCKNGIWPKAVRSTGSQYTSRSQLRACCSPRQLPTPPTAKGCRADASSSPLRAVAATRRLCWNYAATLSQVVSGPSCAAASTACPRLPRPRSAMHGWPTWSRTSFEVRVDTHGRSGARGDRPAQAQAPNRAPQFSLKLTFCVVTTLMSPATHS